MSRRQGFSLCAFLLLSTVHLASDGKAPMATGNPSAPISASECGVPILLSWGDVDGDGRLDLLAVNSEGTLRLFANVGDGRFDDVTEKAGLSEVKNAWLALWADYDGDGRSDLFVGARSGASRLLHNEDGVFADVTTGSGLSSEGAVQSAQWLDHDGDGRLDLFIVSDGENEIFRGLEGGFFERIELPLPAASIAPGPGGLAVSPDGMDAAEGDAPGRATPGSGVRVASVGGPSPDSSVIVGGPSTLGPGGAQGAGWGWCADTVRNQAGGPCLDASTTPGTVNRLYPLTQNLFVSTSGNVGMGTTSPSQKLHINDGAIFLTGSVPSFGGPMIILGGGGPSDPNGQWGMEYDPTAQGLNFWRPWPGFNFGNYFLFLANNGNVGVGTSTPTAKLDVEGMTKTNCLTIEGGCDIVEGFESTDTGCEPGTVVIIDSEHPGKLRASSVGYDKRVAGVVSGAGGVKPGIHLSQVGTLDGELPVAMAGRVYVKASAENGSIAPGDLLTTAATVGHAMRADDATRSHGAVIGKAMTALDAGTGLVLVLVNLQ